MEKVMRANEFYGLFSTAVRSLLIKSGADLEQLQEIRMRIGNPLLLQYGGKEFALTKEGTLTCQAEAGYRTSYADLKETLEAISGYSMYAFDEEMKQGYITVPGGHRVGIAGKIVMDGKKIQCIRHLSFLNIRLSHQIVGCAREIMPYLAEENEICHTLIISPPRCGKTTLLRDIIRSISNGTPEMEGRTVGVVDERSEIAGCYLGVPQNDLGIRTDVLDCCPKAEGMMMLLRSMSPQVIAVDEIGSGEDYHALEQVFHCGCKLIATVHGNSVEDVSSKPLIRQMVQAHMFERYVVLGKEKRAGTVKEIVDGKGVKLYVGAKRSNRGGG